MRSEVTVPIPGNGRPAVATAALFSYWVAFHFAMPGGPSGFGAMGVSTERPINTPERVMELQNMIANSFRAQGQDGAALVGVRPTICVLSFQPLKGESA